MKHLAVTLLVILAVAVQSDAKPKGKDDKHKDKHLTVGDFCVKIQPKCGKITIMRTIEEPENTTANSVDSAQPVRKMKKRPPCEGLKQITVELNEILEVDESGTEVKPKGRYKHKFKDFCKQDFVVGMPRYAMYQNLEAHEVSFSSVVNGANLTLYVYIFNETGNITNGDETKEVTRGTVKFTVNINKWLFCGEEGRRCDQNGTFIELLLRIKGNRQENPYNETVKEKKDKEIEERNKAREKKEEKENEKGKGKKGEKENKEGNKKGKKEDDKKDKDKDKEKDEDKKQGKDDKKGKNKKKSKLFCKSKKRCGRTYYWGEDKVVLFKNVEVDGEMVPMPNGSLVVIQRGDKSLIRLLFPRGKNITYDPTVEISEEVESQVDDSNNNNNKGGEVGGDGNKDNGSSALSSTSFYAAILLMFALLFQA